MSVHDTEHIKRRVHHVHLTDQEVDLAQQVADAHTKEVAARDANAKGSPEELRPLFTFIGALGELAVKKLTGFDWTATFGEYDRRRRDIDQLEVRTARRPWHKLIVKPHDENVPIVLVTIEAFPNDFAVHGWIPGDDAKKGKWWKEPVEGRPAYFVPQDELYDFDPRLKYQTDVGDAVLVTNERGHLTMVSP